MIKFQIENTSFQFDFFSLSVKIICTTNYALRKAKQGLKQNCRDAKCMNTNFRLSRNKDNKSATNFLVYKNFVGRVIYLAKWDIFAQQEISFDPVSLEERSSILLCFLRWKYLIGNRKSSKEIFATKVDKTTQHASERILFATSISATYFMSLRSRGKARITKATRF